MERRMKMKLYGRSWKLWHCYISIQHRRLNRLYHAQIISQETLFFEDWNQLRLIWDKMEICLEWKQLSAHWVFDLHWQEVQVLVDVENPTNQPINGILFDPFNIHYINSLIRGISWGKTKHVSTILHHLHSLISIRWYIIHNFCSWQFLAKPFQKLV